MDCQLCCQATWLRVNMTLISKSHIYKYLVGSWVHSYRGVTWVIGSCVHRTSKARWALYPPAWIPYPPCTWVSPGGQTLTPGHWWPCWALFCVLCMRSLVESLHQPWQGSGTLLTLQRGNLPEKSRDLPKSHTQLSSRARFEARLPVSTACALRETRISQGSFRT